MSVIELKVVVDQYPSCPCGVVQLSVNDKTSQDLLWEYAERRRAVDTDFADDLENALRAAGYVPTAEAGVCRYCSATISAKCHACASCADER